MSSSSANCQLKDKVVGLEPMNTKVLDHGIDFRPKIIYTNEGNSYKYEEIPQMHQSSSDIALQSANRLTLPIKFARGSRPDRGEGSRSAKSGRRR